MPAASGPPLDPARLRSAFDLVGRQAAAGRVAYAALAVGRRQEVVGSRAWLGAAALDAPRRSAIASITKPITATAVLQLVEAGAVVPTEPIATYIPEFRPQPPADARRESEPVTVWHVLTHTAGLGDGPYDAWPLTRADLFERLLEARLRFLPGTTYAYASDSYYLLAQLIERVSGMAYPAFLAGRIFEPLSMTATTFDPSAEGPPTATADGVIGPPDIPYDERLRAMVALELPGGGLWSTADDIIRFGRAILNGGTLEGTRVLGRPFVDLMVRLHTADVRELDTGRAPNYGLGWGLPGLGRGSPASAGAFGHAGASGSILLVDPVNDLVVVYLRNEWGATMTAADEAIQAVYAALES